LSLESTNSKKIFSDAETSSIGGPENLRHLPYNTYQYENDDFNKSNKDYKIEYKTSWHEKENSKKKINTNSNHEYFDYNSNPNNIQINENYNINNEYLHTFNNKNNNDEINERSYDEYSNKSKKPNEYINYENDVKFTQSSNPEILVSDHPNNIKTGEYNINDFYNSKNYNQVSNINNSNSINNNLPQIGFSNNNNSLKEFNPQCYIQSENKQIVSEALIYHRNNTMRDFTNLHLNDLDTSKFQKREHDNDQMIKSNNDLNDLNIEKQLKFPKSEINFSFNNLNNINHSNSIVKENIVNTSQIKNANISQNINKLDETKNRDENNNLITEKINYNYFEPLILSSINSLKSKNYNQLKNEENNNLKNNTEFLKKIDYTEKDEFIIDNDVKFEYPLLNSANFQKTDYGSLTFPKIEKDSNEKNLIESNIDNFNFQINDGKNLIKEDNSNNLIQNFYGENKKSNHGFNFHNSKSINYNISNNKNKQLFKVSKEDSEKINNLKNSNFKQADENSINDMNNSYSNYVNNFQKDLDLKKKLQINNNCYNLFEKILIIFNNNYEKNLGFYFSEFIENFNFKQKQIDDFIEAKIKEPLKLRGIILKNSNFFEKLKVRINTIKHEKVLKLKLSNIKNETNRMIKSKIWNGFKKFKKQFDLWLKYTRKELQKNLIW